MALARTLLILTTLAVPGAVLAQETAPAPPGTLDSPPEQIEPGPPVGSPGSGETLGEALGESRGVIQPPAGVDPGMVEPTPPAGQFPTPVIPPSSVTPEAQPR